MKTFLTLLLFAASAGSSIAQLAVHLQMDRTQYLENESVSAVVTITNRAGREVFLHTVPRGRLQKSWLDFSVRDGRGKPLHPRRMPEFRAAKIPPGQSISKRIVLNNLFGVNQPDRYTMTAHVRMNDISYNSNNGQFGVQNGRTVFRSRFGAPKTKFPEREYRVISFNDGRRTSIYVAVHDARTQGSIHTQRLSEALLFHKPSAAIDGKNNLHLVYLSNPEIYVHAIVDKDGKILKTQFYKSSRLGNPSLIAFANGEIKVRNGLIYDPKKEAELKNRARQITDRPR